MKPEKYYFGYTTKLPTNNDRLLIVGSDKYLTKLYIEKVRNLPEKYYYIEEIEYDPRRDDYREVNDNMDYVGCPYYSYYLPSIDVKRIKEDFDNFLNKLEDTNKINKELLYIVSNNYKKGDRLGLSRSIFDYSKLLDEFIDLENMRTRLEKAYIPNHPIFTDSIAMYFARLDEYREYKDFSFTL